MPGKDGTGPLGLGAINGRGLGFCSGPGDGRGLGLGRGPGLGRGLGRGSVCRRVFGVCSIADPTVSKTQKELLEEQKEMLQRRLDIIGEQLGNL